jgi:hypothetical protein
MPFLVAVNLFDGAARFDPAEVREALGVEQAPIVECDARSREDVKKVLVSLAEQVLIRRAASVGARNVR